MIGDPPKLDGGVNPVEWLRQRGLIDRLKGQEILAKESEALADWLATALEREKRDACRPDLPMILNERGERTYSPFGGHEFGDEACGWPGRSTGPMPLWEPNEISPGRWQAMRETGNGLSRYRHFDTAIDTLEGGYAERKAMIFGTISECESRCFELNRRLRIG